MKKEEVNENYMELVGVLQSISIVAKNLAKKLMKIEAEVKRREKNLS